MNVIAWLTSVGAAMLRRSPSFLSAGGWRAAQLSFSHFGEDVIVHALLSRSAVGIKRGIYVDIGAFDPILFSNTYLLHLNGWRGLNIEPNSARLDAFRRIRPHDVNLLAAVSDTARNVVYLHYPSPGLNCIGTDEKKNYSTLANQMGELPIRIEEIRAESIADLLHKHIADSEQIDFLDIDCEGEDLHIMSGFPWHTWRPRVVAVEANTDDARDILIEFMHGHRYTLVAQAIVTLIFVTDGDRDVAGENANRADEPPGFPSNRVE